MMAMIFLASELLVSVTSSDQDSWCTPGVVGLFAYIFVYMTVAWRFAFVAWWMEQGIGVARRPSLIAWEAIVLLLASVNAFLFTSLDRRGPRIAFATLLLLQAVSLLFASVARCLHVLGSLRKSQSMNAQSAALAASDYQFHDSEEQQRQRRTRGRSKSDAHGALGAVMVPLATTMAPADSRESGADGEEEQDDADDGATHNDSSAAEHQLATAVAGSLDS